MTNTDIARARHAYARLDWLTAEWRKEDTPSRCQALMAQIEALRAEIDTLRFGA